MFAAQWWLDRSVKAKALTVLAVPLIALFGTTSASLVLEHDEQTSRAGALKAFDLITTGDQVLTDVINAETGVRGYAATGNPGFLDPYNLALARIGTDRRAYAGAASALGETRAHRSVDAAAIKVLTDLASVRLAESKGAAPGSLTQPLLADRTDMGRLRTLTAALGQAPAERLTSGRSAASRLESEIGTLDAAGLVLGVLAVIAGITLFTTGISRRVDATADLALEPELAPDTDSGLAVIVSPDSEVTEPLPIRPGMRASLWVLYIEDNPANVEVVACYLRNRADAHLAAYSCGHEGYEYAAVNRPDIILLDLHLPGAQGEEALTQLKSDPATAGIPVVVLSADATPAMIKRLTAAGALAYLAKPLNLSELGEILDSLPKTAASIPNVPRQGTSPEDRVSDRIL